MRAAKFHHGEVVLAIDRRMHCQRVLAQIIPIIMTADVLQLCKATAQSVEHIMLVSLFKKYFADFEEFNIPRNDKHGVDELIVSGLEPRQCQSRQAWKSTGAARDPSNPRAVQGGGTLIRSSTARLSRMTETSSTKSLSVAFSRQST